ncbi:hypothetical protein C7S15_6054 [Burkholderia cepacia]|nr:hypothetical protein [Burkholderia cepacia]
MRGRVHRVVATPLRTAHRKTSSCDRSVRTEAIQDATGAPIRRSILRRRR